MYANYSEEIKIAIFQPFRNANVTYQDRPKIAGAWRQKLDVLNSQITGRKLTKFGPSSVHKELLYGAKIAKIGLVYPEIFDKIRQFFWLCYT